MSRSLFVLSSLSIYAHQTWSIGDYYILQYHPLVLFVLLIVVRLSLSCVVMHSWLLGVDLLGLLWCCFPLCCCLLSALVISNHRIVSSWVVVLNEVSLSIPCSSRVPRRQWGFWGHQEGGTLCTYLQTMKMKKRMHPSSLAMLLLCMPLLLLLKWLLLW